MGCHDIFRCLLSVTEEKSVSCLQARKISQEMNAAFVESRKSCRVKILISSKSLINIHTSGISTYIQAIHTIFYLFSAGAPKSVWFLFPALSLLQRTCNSLRQLLGTKDTCLMLRCSLKKNTLGINACHQSWELPLGKPYYNDTVCT